MGRTNPTYRHWLERCERDWQPFRRALRRRYRDDFDRLFEKAHRHAATAGFANPADPMEGALVSILLAQECEIRELRERVAALEAQLDGE